VVPPRRGRRLTGGQGSWRQRLSRRGAEEGGFAFIEVVVACTVLFVASFAVGSQLDTQFVSISSSEAQQAGAGLLNQAMEEVRGLPYTFVSTGLSLSDATTTSDPYLSIVGQTCKTNNTSIWPTAEVVPCAAPSNESQPPFAPHISHPVEDGITFSVATYPSIDAADTGTGPNVYRVTAVVSWGTPQPGPNRLVAQTLVFSAASGCLAQNNHPFAAPCQPFLYGVTATGGGYINITPQAGSADPPILGDSFDSVELLFVSASAADEIEQVSTVLGTTQTSGGSISSSGDTQTSGWSRASATADNDPGTSHNLSSPPANGSPIVVSNSSPSTITAAGTGEYANSISVVPGSADSGGTVATAVAGANPACKDLGGSTQMSNLPCANSSATQGGTAASVLMSLFAGSSSLGSTPLASVAAQSASYPDEGFVGRYTASNSPYCSGTSGDGCVHAAAEEALGTIELAGLPSQVVSDGAAPAGWGTATAQCPAGNYLLAVTNFSASATSESGVASASPSVSVPVAGAPTPYVCSWSGTGYTATPITWGATAPAISFPSVSVTDASVASGPVTVTITPSLQLEPTATSTSTNTGCASVCTASAGVPSPVEGDISSVVQHLHLGDLLAATSYQAAP
jgi:hypothetical protein